MNVHIGVLALQGDFREHIAILRKLKTPAQEIRTKQELAAVDGLIIPGGESTTISKLMRKYGLDKTIIARAAQGMPIYGTCAGAILLSKTILGQKQQGLGLINVDIKRNDYGRQIDSFEATLHLGNKPFNAFFIRAPILKRIGKNVEVLCSYEKHVVCAKQKTILISTFHPELSGETAVHQLFVGMVHGYQRTKTPQSTGKTAYGQTVHHHAE